MADELDDFFNDIEEVAAEAAQESDTSNNSKDEPTEEPPTKRAKVASSAPIRPKGMVVAAASSSVIKKPTKTPEEEEEEFLLGTGSSITPPPPTVATSTPPPPPPPPPQATTAPSTGSSNSHNIKQQQPNKPLKRTAAGKTWVDPTLQDWPTDDFRIFVGNLDPSITDAQLHAHFAKYPSLARSKVVADGENSKGYGFVSMLQPLDCAKAIREMDQTWLGSRTIRVKRSDWKDRNRNQVNKQKKKYAKQQRKRFGM